MMKFLFFLLISAISCACADESLEDLPPATIENLRWNIPADDWLQKEKYFLKGEYFKINSSLEDIKKNPDGTQVRKLNIYSDPELKSKMIGVSGGKIYSPSDSVVCKRFPTVKTEARNHFIECVSGGCKEVKSPDIDHQINPLLALSLQMKKSETLECPFNLQYTYVEGLNVNEFATVALFKFNRIDTSKKYVEISVNGKPAYLDVRKCDLDSNNQSSSCKVVNIEKSKYEENWIALKKIQKDKSHSKLNDAIKLIQPCLKTSDYKCIQKYILSRSDEGPDFYETKITSEIVKELKSCLDYSKLLPHLLASRGIEKACIFGHGEFGGKPLRGVTFIEALSSNPINVKLK